MALTTLDLDAVEASLLTPIVVVSLVEVVGVAKVVPHHPFADNVSAVLFLAHVSGRDS
jgi:hypothetical protein